MAEIVAAIPQEGGFFSTPKIVLMLVLIVPWLLALPRVSKDCQRLGISLATWNGIVMGCGMLGILLWLVIPIFIGGLMAFLGLAIIPLVAYVFHRNAKVPPERRILTAEHINSLFGKKRRSFQEVKVLSDIKIYGANSRVIIPPELGVADEQAIRAYNTAQTLLYDIVWRRASEADLKPAGEGTVLTLVVDGVGTETPGPSASRAAAAIQFIKEHAGMEVEERRRPQKGRLGVGLEDRTVDVAVTVAGTTHGQRAQFRVEQEAVRTDLESLGMAEDQLAAVRRMIDEDHGLVICSGRRNSGVTSTLYSILRAHDAFTKLLVTLERNPKIRLENITQNVWEDERELARQISSTIRRGADVLMVDECPNESAAEAIAGAAGEKNILLGIRAADAFTALAKWIKASGDAAAAVEPLRAVLCQVLLRKLCIGCKEAYRPDPQFLAKANLQSAQVDTFYRPRSEPLQDAKGNTYVCPVCQGTGYVGRTAAFELMEVTEEVRGLVVSGASLSQIKAQCRKQKMLYLQERALQKVLSGETSVKEVIRVTQQKDRSSGGDKA